MINGMGKSEKIGGSEWVKIPLDLPSKSEPKKPAKTEKLAPSQKTLVSPQAASEVSKIIAQHFIPQAEDMHVFVRSGDRRTREAALDFRNVLVPQGEDATAFMLNLTEKVSKYNPVPPKKDGSVLLG